MRGFVVRGMRILTLPSRGNGNDFNKSPRSPTGRKVSGAGRTPIFPGQPGIKVRVCPVCGRRKCRHGL